MSTIPNQRFIDGVHPEQLAVLKAFDERTKRFFMLKWHRRARKTTLGVNILIRACCSNKNKVFPYIGPTYKQAKNIVWLDPNMLFTYLPPQNHRQFGWIKNESELYIKFKTGCILPIKGADDPDTIRGIDAHGAFFDEWALQKEMIWTEIFRPIMAQDPNRWAIFAYTPELPHALEMWNRTKGWKDWHHSELKASISGLIPQAELDKCRLEMPPWMYDREFECTDIVDEELTLITSRLLDGLPRSLVKVGASRRRIVSCDPDASVDGDECVIYAMENNKVIDEDIFHECDPLKIGAKVVLMMEKHDIKDSIVDSIGVGAGVVGYLNMVHKRCMPFVSNEKAAEHHRFANKRAEAWWHVMQEMMDNNVEYPVDLTLRQELSSVRVKPGGRGGKVLLENKQLGTKKRLGRSPDRGDTYVMGIYGSQFVLNEKSVWHDDIGDEPVMAESSGAIRSEF